MVSRDNTEDCAERSPIPLEAGIGLRFRHHRAVIDERPDLAWLEIHTENYMGGGTPLRDLEAIRRDYPIALHGVGLSLGSVDNLDTKHLDRFRMLIDSIEPGLVSEHLAWSIVDRTYLADLLPLPMTEEALDVVCRHVDQTQAHLRRRILLENPSTYLCFRHSVIPECDFLAAVARRTGCGILCDVNNLYVSACNHGWNSTDYLAALPAAAVGEIHLAGHTAKTLDGGITLRIDDHRSRVADAVWMLYGEAIRRFGRVPTLIEWDTNVPTLAILTEEAEKAGRVLDVIAPRPVDADAA